MSLILPGPRDVGTADHGVGYEDQMETNGRWADGEREIYEWVSALGVAAVVRSMCRGDRRQRSSRALLGSEHSTLVEETKLLTNRTMGLHALIRGRARRPRATSQAAPATAVRALTGRASGQNDPTPAAEAENGATDRVSKEDDSRDAIDLLVGEAGPAEVLSRSRPWCHSVWMLLGGWGWTCATRGFSIWRGELSR